MLEFLQKLTHHPDEVSAADIATLRAAGLSDEHIEDAVAVCSAFHMITRLADSFEFHVPEEAGFTRSAHHLLRRGYL